MTVSVGFHMSHDGFVARPDDSVGPPARLVQQRAGGTPPFAGRRGDSAARARK